MSPALANLSRRLADSLGDRDTGEAQGMGEAPLAMVAGAMGCPMLGTVDSVEASTRPLSSVVRESSTHSFFSGSLEVAKSKILCCLTVEQCLLSFQV